MLCTSCSHTRHLPSTDQHILTFLIYVVEVLFSGSPDFLVDVYHFFNFMIRLYCVDRLSLWICVLLLLSGILYFSCILLYYLDCYFCIIFPHINTLYYTGHFVYVDCFVLYCIFIYIREMVLCSEWWFMLHWCCVGYQHSIWIYWPL